MHHSRKSDDCGHVKGPPLTDAEFRDWFRHIVHDNTAIYRLLTPVEVLTALAALEAYDGSVTLHAHLTGYSLTTLAATAEAAHVN